MMICGCRGTADIRDLQEDECPSVVELFDACLGEKFIGVEAVRGLVDNPDALVVGSFCGDRLISAATAMLMADRGQLLAGMPVDQRGAIRALLPAGVPVGLLKSSAVTASHRGLGVGAAMVHARMDILGARGAGAFLSLGWTDGAGCHAQKPLERGGLQAVADIPDFWREDSLAAGYGCPSCGHPCRCIARVFTRVLRTGRPG